MVDYKTDFFVYVDNFKKIEGVESVKLFGDDDPSAQFTIAIPTFKRTAYLREAINSALNQDCDFTYNVIVVDNNPIRDDETEKMMQSYNGVHNLTYYKNKDNLGMAGNWNRLFQLSKSRWVVMLHDDDVLYPYYLRTCDEIIRSNNNIDILKPKEDKAFNPSFHNRGRIKQLFCIDFYYGNKCATPSGMLFKKDSVLKSGGYNQDYYPSLDYCFHARFAALYNLFVYSESLMYYRIGINESCKVSVQHAWLIVDSFLIRQLLRKYHFPQWVVEGFASRRTTNTHRELQKKWGNKFEFELCEVKLKEVSEIRGLIAHAIIRIFQIIYVFYKKVWRFFSAATI